MVALARLWLPTPASPQPPPACPPPTWTPSVIHITGVEKNYLKNQQHLKSLKD